MTTLKTVMVTGPAGEVRINETDLSVYEQQGYKLLVEKPTKQTTDTDTKSTKKSDK